MAIVWAVQPSRMIEDIEKDIRDRYEDFAILVFNEVVSNSPVLSGRYRGNHMVGVGSPNSNITDSTAVPVLNKGFYFLRDFVPIYITNNLPYAQRIEHGWSGKAPSGVYGISAQVVGG